MEVHCDIDCRGKNGDTYGLIAKLCAKFTVANYGLSTVVFDGYNNGPSIKDNTHQRRGCKIVYPEVYVAMNTVFEGRKEHFLSRHRNTQSLIDIISSELRRKECRVINSLKDANVDIIKAAVEESYRRSANLIGEDTDLLVVLLYFAKLDCKDLYFRSDKNQCQRNLS